MVINGHIMSTSTFSRSQQVTESSEKDEITKNEKYSENNVIVSS